MRCKEKRVCDAQCRPSRVYHDDSECCFGAIPIDLSRVRQRSRCASCSVAIDSLTRTTGRRQPCASVVSLSRGPGGRARTSAHPLFTITCITYAHASDMLLSSGACLRSCRLWRSQKPRTHHQCLLAPACAQRTNCHQACTLGRSIVYVVQACRGIICDRVRCSQHQFPHTVCASETLTNAR